MTTLNPYRFLRSHPSSPTYWAQFFIFLVAFFCSASTVYAGVVVTDVTDIGELPTTPNNGGVIGYDAGMSVHFGSFSYWFFGDANRDYNRPNGNWQLDNVLEGFSFGTHVGRTFDTAAGNGITGMVYKTDEPWNAERLLENAPNECVVWPAGGVGTSLGDLYLYFTAWGDCSGSWVTDHQGQGLAKFTDLIDMDVERLPGYVLPSMPPKWTGPISASFDTPCGAAHYVYLFGLDGTDVMLTRVADVDIEDSSKYRFWDGAGWVPDAEKVEPIMQIIGGSSFFSVAYNEFVDRWIAIYSCGIGSQVCMNHTTHAGADPNRMSEGWTSGEVIYSCPAGATWRCKHAFQHAQLAHGRYIYITTARHSGPGDPEHITYNLQLHQFRLDWE
ncbi:DUF4185 domain-containing protein [Myxococcota bacterium]|nr:DUF4185 domain-containing protein [Myxococcota bacterium]